MLQMSCLSWLRATACTLYSTTAYVKHEQCIPDLPHAQLLSTTGQDCKQSLQELHQGLICAAPPYAGKQVSIADITDVMLTSQ